MSEPIPKAMPGYDLQDQDYLRAVIERRLQDLEQRVARLYGVPGDGQVAVFNENAELEGADALGWDGDTLTVVDTLNVGIDDDTPGVIEVFGGGDTEDGGQIKVHNPNDEDTVVDNYVITTDGFGGFGFYRRGGTSGDPSAGDFVIQGDGKLFLAYNQGEVQVGDSGTSTTNLRLEGGATIANLPTTRRVTGSVCLITDGDAALSPGDTAVNSGAGATPYLVWYNGTNWTVIGV